MLISTARTVDKIVPSQTPATVSSPNDPITREQLAVILFRYAQYKGMDTVTLEENLTGFADADEISGYAVSALNWAVGAGVLKGTGTGLAPKANATRSEVAQMLMNFDQNVMK